MTYKQAIAEAYASAPIDEVVLNTLELRHPSFVDDLGNPIAVRLVRAYENYDLTLENNAPVQGGQTVTFIACAFEFQLPAFAEGKTPELMIRVDNASREITKYLEQAVAQIVPIGVTYRPYLASDPSGPQMDPPYHMTLSKVTVDTFQVTGTATMNDVHNWPFPSEKYTPARFPGLVR